MIYPEQAFNTFWSSFNIPAFDESVTLIKRPFPYITYQLAEGDFNGGDVPMNVSIWDENSQGHSALTFLAEKAEEIRIKIGNNGILIPVEHGKIWIKRGKPFAQNMSEEGNPNIRRKLLLIYAEYITTE